MWSLSLTFRKGTWRIRGGISWPVTCFFIRKLVHVFHDKINQLFTEYGVANYVAIITWKPSVLCNTGTNE